MDINATLIATLAATILGHYATKETAHYNSDASVITTYNASREDVRSAVAVARMIIHEVRATESVVS